VTRYPHLFEEWHRTRNGALDPYTVAASSVRQVWWRCRHCGREWQSSPAARRQRPRRMSDLRQIKRTTAPPSERIGATALLGRLRESPRTPSDAPNSLCQWGWTQPSDALIGKTVLLYTLRDPLGSDLI
jgi:hypothetical protein